MYACALPLVMPMLLAMHWFGFDPMVADWRGDLGLQIKLGTSLLVSLLAVILYPRDGKLSGWPLSKLRACLPLSLQQTDHGF